MKNLKKDTRNSFIIKDFSIFKLVNVVDENGRSLIKKFCFNCEVYSNLVIAGKWLLLGDGRCLKIKQKCGDSDLVVAVEYLNFSGDAEKGSGNISYFRVFNLEGEEVFHLKHYSVCFSDMQTTMFHSNLIFEEDYFEFEGESGCGALSLDGRILVPAEYIYLYLEKDTDFGEPVFYCFKDEDGDNYDLYTLSGNPVVD